MEPAAVTIVRPSGEVIAQLVVNPSKPIARLKTQIAGLEGTPVSNQIWMLGDRKVENDATLSSLGVESATFVLLQSAPLLSGALAREDLEHLLADGRALDEAIDAYSDNLEYLPSDLQAISAAVCGALLPSVCLAPESTSEQLKDLATATTGRARQIAFAAALRAELERVRALLPQCSPPATAEAASCGPQEEQLDQDAASPQASSPGADRLGVASKQHRSSTPWEGAGHELRTRLEGRWSASEGRMAGSE
eukprot:TRINITY_DN108036_c0_g1_i1.p1 TRINITY_DN108036_c0_g1~~TRINITY_DN108036_c0_g1_i1.p1  ORF type:complete len:251 (+),score=52.45 TRINITY_DN108036_c0_g1_i1:55-807(+)